MFSNCDEESRRKIRNIVFDSGLKKNSDINQPL